MADNSKKKPESYLGNTLESARINREIAGDPKHQNDAPVLKIACGKLHQSLREISTTLDLHQRGEMIGTPKDTLKEAAEFLNKTRLPNNCKKPSAQPPVPPKLIV